MELRKLTVEDFMQETGSSSPAPGGGSIAALNAASSAALVEMVAHLTIGKEKYASVEPEMKDVVDKAASLRKEFLALIEEDSTAFTKIMSAFKMPKTNEKEKVKRHDAIQEATKGAALVPFKIGELAAGLFDLANAVICHGNSNAVTDGAIAAMNARTAVHSAFLNVKINLNSIKDQAFVADMAQKMTAIEKTVDQKEKELLSKAGF
jgi:formiminotetrahydrofolate cyclodeaminase